MGWPKLGMSTGRAAGAGSQSLSLRPRRALAGAGILPGMSNHTSSKVLLVADRRSASSALDDIPVRRYRLARLRLTGAEPEQASRLGQPKPR